MYLNIQFLPYIIYYAIVKPGHEMYLNISVLVLNTPPPTVKPGHEMYLNSAKPTNPPALYPR